MNYKASNGSDVHPLSETAGAAGAPVPQETLFPYDFSRINNHGFRLAPRPYCFYRISMLILSSALFTLLLLYGPELRNFAYLTYWGFTALLVYFLVGATEAVAMRIMGPRLRVPVWKFLHFLYVNLLGVEVMINGVFWLVFFPFIIHYHRQSNIPLSLLDIVQAVGAHLLPFSMLLFDGYHNLVCLWNRHPRRYLIGTLLFYLGFNMIYTLRQGPIYPVMTYRDYLTYVFVGGNVLGAYVCYEVLFFTSRKFKNSKVRSFLEDATPLIMLQKGLSDAYGGQPPTNSRLQLPQRGGTKQREATQGTDRHQAGAE